MKNVLILNDCKYAQSKPSLPILTFTKGDNCCLDSYLADSIISNGDGKEFTVEPEIEIEPEIEDKLNHETKEKPKKSKSRSGKGNK